MNFYEQFKIVRNRIRKFDSISLITRTSSKLHEIEYKEITDWNGWLPWNLLLLIKWSAEHGGSYYPPKEFSDKSLVNISNLMHDFASTNDFLDQGDEGGLRKFMRVLAFQQFWIQRSVSSWEVVRQYILFTGEENEDPVRENFKKITGLEPKLFLQISLLLYSSFLKDQNLGFFNPFLVFSNTNLSQESIRNYFLSMSLTVSQLIDYEKNRKGRIQNPYRQLTELTPLVNFPFLQHDKGFLLYSRKVFEQTIARKIYNVTKEYGGSALAEIFSKRFENYIGNILTGIYDNLYSESELSKAFSGMKTPDFLLPFDDCTVIIEAKAIEMRPSVQVFPANKQLDSELSDSVIKAVVQAFSLVQELSKQKDDLDIPNRSNYFLLIVTYRDLYLGPGQDMWSEFLKEAIDKRLKKHEREISFLPPQQMATISIEEFDQLFSTVYSEQDTLPKILQNMTKTNSDEKTKKHCFAMHLAPYDHVKYDLPFHAELHKAIWKELEETLIKT